MSHIRYDSPARHVARITLNRPEARNAYSVQMVDELCAAFDRAEDDDDIWVVILTGAGPSFSAGGDLKAMKERSGMFAGDSIRLRKAYMRNIQRVPRRLLAFDKPIIAAVNGAAIGAGLDLACMCDIRVVSEKAKLGSTFVKLGLIPGDGGSYFLSRVVGYPMAMQMILTGEIIVGDEVMRRGLANELVEREQVMNASLAWADKLCANGPVALRLARQAMIRSWDLTALQALELAATYQSISQLTSDHDEGVDAILDKRAPKYEGR